MLSNKHSIGWTKWGVDCIRTYSQIDVILDLYLPSRIFDLNSEMKMEYPINPGVLLVACSVHCILSSDVPFQSICKRF